MPDFLFLDRWKKIQDTRYKAPGIMRLPLTTAPSNCLLPQKCSNSNLQPQTLKQFPNTSFTPSHEFLILPTSQFILRAGDPSACFVLSTCAHYRMTVRRGEIAASCELRASSLLICNLSVLRLYRCCKFFSKSFMRWQNTNFKPQTSNLKQFRISST